MPDSPEPDAPALMHHDDRVWQDPSPKLLPAMALTLLIVFGIVVVAICLNRHANSELLKHYQNRQFLVAFHQAAMLRQKIDGVIAELENFNRCVASGHDPAESDLKTQFAMLLKRSPGQLAGAGFVNTRGELAQYVNADGPQPQTDLSYDESIREALATRKTLVSGIAVTSDGHDAVRICVPVFSNGEFRGLTIGAVTSETLGRWLVRPQDDGYSLTIVLDADYRIAFHPGAEFIHQSMLNGLLTESNRSDFRSASLKDAQRGTMRGPVLGDKLYIYGVAACDLPGTRWRLVSCIPHANVAAPILRFSRFTSILIGLTFLVSMLGFICAIYMFKVNRTAWAEQRAKLRADIRRHQSIEKERQELISELEIKNAELERFAYTVSHDLKSPLITIRGFLGSLQKGIRDGNQERVNDDIARIASAAEKMQVLLDDLLELSRVGRQEGPSEEVKLNDTAAEVLELVAGRTQDRHIDIEVAPDLPTVRSQKARMREVMQNLVENAIKFMGDQPQPRIDIGVRQEAGEHIIFVKDNGAGIDPKYLDRVFHLFEQLDPDIEGSGMGLAMAKRIIEHNGGRIWAESEGLGSGTAFCFTLPQTDDPEQEQKQAADEQ